MILLFPQKTAIITPPKTASSSLHSLFTAPPWNGWCVVGPHHGGTDKHCVAVPNEGYGFRKLLVVRNPYDRLVSLWHHLGRWEAYHGRGFEPFAAFAKRVAAGNAGWFYKTTVSELVGDTPVDGVIHVENLRDDLAAAGLEVAAVPKWNDSYRRPWPDYYTPELLEAVLPWASADCERFGYPSVPAVTASPTN